MACLFLCLILYLVFYYLCRCNQGTLPVRANDKESEGINNSRWESDGSLLYHGHQVCLMPSYS